MKKNIIFTSFYNNLKKLFLSTLSNNLKINEYIIVPEEKIILNKDDLKNLKNCKKNYNTYIKLTDNIQKLKKTTQLILKEIESNDGILLYLFIPIIKKQTVSFKIFIISNNNKFLIKNAKIIIINKNNLGEELKENELKKSNRIFKDCTTFKEENEENIYKNEIIKKLCTHFILFESDEIKNTKEYNEIKKKFLEICDYFYSDYFNYNYNIFKK